MTITQRFKNGLYIGLKSFGLLWEHKNLILYLGTPVLAGIILELIIYNFFLFAPSGATRLSYGLMTQIVASFGDMQTVGIFVVEMVTLLVTIFASVALIYHTHKILNKKYMSVKQALRDCMPKLKQVFVWAAISTIVLALIRRIELTATTGAHDNHLLLLLTAALRIAWALPLLFVIPGIALENKSLKELVLESFQIVQRKFFEYCGGIFWICLIGALAYVLLDLFEFKNALTLTASYVLLTLVGFTLSTVHNILKTKLYWDYKKRG